MRFKVNPRVLRAGSPIFKTILKGRDSPIVLSGHTASQFRTFLWAVYAQPLPSAKSFDVARLCSIAEVSFKYDFNSLKLWSMEGIKSLVESPNTILRTAASETFVRLIRLALLYRDPALSRTVQSKWLTRLHWHDLPAAPALVVADAHDLRHLLYHAYYVHLVDVAPRIDREQPIDDGDSPLSTVQNLHVFCGYHSLLAAWKQLQESAPSFTPDAACSSHSKCLIAWNARWALETRARECGVCACRRAASATVHGAAPGGGRGGGGLHDCRVYESGATCDRDEKGGDFG
ncbi:hypothetical protein C8F04DRAFT_1197678 [Mycena alexandri]|uniref:BTB domain-containing protein n=1 Tax=Mycena alexandri TaxID=1745969 RepID=A0AAD6WM66_9AGAR|nr:hypothetical protein C8F04DRAFT_1197678 [Mycena alexandri]